MTPFPGRAGAATHPKVTRRPPFSAPPTTPGREGGALCGDSTQPSSADDPGPRGRGRRPGARGNHRRAKGPTKGARLPVGVEPESPPPKGLTRGSVVGRAAA